ncbi:MAG TPA: RpiB/LacA/LacB family sugar-phosphate isomerase [Candidatus Saccharimonadales bacterium]|nr:RpiB/LacA/LacB family sugar-phosphate isomerase [Candidatus Saccharimonadales bacterium]
MKIYIDADHNGFDMKQRLTEELTRAGFEVVDVGNTTVDPDDDYPQAAARVVSAMRASEDDEPRGILLCGSGQGVCIAANRYKGIRASLIWNADEATAARNDDDCNVLCLPARYVHTGEAIDLAETWLKTPFAGAARYKRRIKELDAGMQ